jgi:hypothetical protein
MTFFAGSRPVEYEVLSLSALITFIATIFARGSDVVPGVFLGLSALSSGIAAYLDLTATMSKLLSRPASSNPDAHDAVTLAVFAIFGHPSVLLMVQAARRHLEVLTGGKLFSRDVCTSIKQFVQESMRFSVFFDPMILLELLLMTVMRHDLQTLLCLFVHVVVETTFRYTTSRECKELWQNLYQAFVGMANQQQEGQLRVWMFKAIDFFDSCASISEQLWPPRRLKLKIQ